MREKLRKIGKNANGMAQSVAVGVVTGLFAGVVVTLFNVLFEDAEAFSRGFYIWFAEHPAFLPLLFIALFAGAVLIGGVMRVLPYLRGSGFAQTEGATRGLFRFRWYEAMTGMFASSLFVVLMGLSGGAEGPSVFIGGACGDCTGAIFHRGDRRFPITSGASAGLAVGLNAPLTGIIFAYEEAHKKFTPEVFVCSFSSVAVAIVVRSLLFMGMGLPEEPYLSAFSFPQEIELMFCLYALLGALAVSLVAVLFYYLILWLHKLLGRVRFWKGIGVYLFPFLLAGSCGLLSVYAMGSGRAVILGAAEGTLTFFGLPLWAALFCLLLLRFFVSAVNTGAGLPCCASVPMLAMGALIGAMLRSPFIGMGMDPACGDLLIALLMVTFFTAVVKAPVTGIVMTLELTWQFSFLLPAIICAAVAYFVGDIFRTEPLYEVLLEKMRDDITKRAV